MRRKLKKEHVLIGGIILVLMIALVQLGMLIYKTYNSSEEPKEYIEFRMNDIQNATVKLVQNGHKIEPMENNVYSVEKGVEFTLKCKAEDAYGMESLKINGENRGIENIQKQEFVITPEVDCECVLTVKKVYKIEIKNIGNGSTTFENTGEGNNFFIFEGNKIKMNCIADEYNYIKSITVNGGIEFEYKEGDIDYFQKYDYTSHEVDRDYYIVVEYKVKKCAINVNEDSNISVTINDEKVNELIVDAGTDIVIKIDCSNAEGNAYIDRILVNRLGQKLGQDHSQIETLTLSKVDSSKDIRVKLKYVNLVSDEPEQVFKIVSKEFMECSYRVLKEKNRIIYYLRSKEDIVVSAKNKFERILIGGTNSMDKESILVSNNTQWKKCYLFTEDNEEVLYAYPIQFIFDTDPPATPTYTLSHQSLTKIKITTTIKDSGESGVDSVQFGTKSDYDANLSSDETIKKYGYEINNTADTTYKIAIDQATLKGEDYYIWATDNATNRSTPTKIDLTGPELNITTKADWSNQDVIIEGTAKDEENRVGVICYSTNKEAAEAHYYDKEKDGNVSKSTIGDNGAFTIECKSEKSGVIKYYIWGYDNYGNKSKEIQTYEAKIDKKAPVVTLVKKSPSAKWTNKAVTMEFTAMDKEEQGYSGIDKIYYSMENDASNVTNLEVNKNEEQSYVIQTPKDKDGKIAAMQGYYFIYAADKAGNLSKPLKVEVNIDVDAPKACNVQMLAKDGTEVTTEKYGTFANQAIQLEVAAQDLYRIGQDKQTVASGTKEIQVLCNGKQVAKGKAKEDGTTKEGRCVFELKPQLAGELTIVTYDYAGNVSEPIKISDINPAYHSFVCLETGCPEIQLECEKAAYKDESKAEWFGEHKDFRVTVKDKLAGIRKVEAVLNGNTLRKQSNGKDVVKIDHNKKTEEATFVINSGQNGASEDGHYTLELRVYDNAGNSKNYNRTIYVDDQEPVITKFAFEATGVQDHKDKLIEKMDYGYFFNGSTKVVVSAADEKPSSGIKEIEYYLVDYSKKKEGVESKKKVIKTDTEGNASFVIDKKFKGKICARAFDAVHNTTANYAKPYGIVIDSSEKDNKNSQIAFTSPDTSMKDNQGNPLYNKDVDITVDAANYFKGIKSVEWEVNSDGDEKGQSGKIEVSSSGQLSGAHSGYQILETDKNLVTHLQGKVHVSGNTNKIRLHVVLTDRSGLQSEKELYLSIDKSKPQVSISFDKSHESTYYNEDRTATISIKDKNFNPNQVELFLQNTNGGVPKLSSWSKQKDGETYTATLAFASDGLYALNVTSKDLAGNKSDTVAAQTFTIDKTKPEIDIKLNQMKEKADNIGYYNQSVKARISVSEYNFDIKKVEVTGTAKYKDKGIAYPKLYYLHSTKQSHEMELEFTEEGEYTLRLKCTDEAGNVSESKMEYHFIVDKSQPEITINGVEDSKAYNGTLVPQVTVTDVNYKAETTKISLSNGKGETVAIRPKVNKVSDGYNFVLDCFPKEKEYDEVYQLGIESSDRAGNRSSKKLYFSVNRFGSSYQFSELLQKAAGKYSNEQFDVVLTETNVNAIDPSKSLVRMICNDTVTDLVENQDYKVEASGGDGKWYTYRYQISKNLLKEDGIYQFALYTKDEAGNVNENSEEGKKALVWFGMDRTAPRIIPINISDGGTYNETKRFVSFHVDDNIRMESAMIYVNGAEVESTVEDNQYVVEMGSSNKAQNIRVVAKDLAGNTTDIKISNLYITTNLFVRIIHNRTLITIFSIIVCTAFMGTLIVFLLYRKKHKKVME